MLTVYSDAHLAHAPGHEMHRGVRVEAFERPERALNVLKAVERARLGEIVPPADFGEAPIRAVHADRYVDFLKMAWSRWTGLGHQDDAFPTVWPLRTLRHDIEPENFSAALGLYAMDAGTPLTAGSWGAAYAGAQSALTALDAVLDGRPAAFSLSRPPGHHAGADFMGGYCFLNNAAIAAQAWRDRGAARVAILDVDYHHGNGTQSIFYDRPDVLYVSLHGDPLTEYPFYLGHADETGSGAGAGCNFNLPLPAGASADRWFAELERASAAIRAFAPDALVVSLGVDTAATDPIAHFNLGLADFARLGDRLAALRLPSVIVMEGGYDIPAIGDHVAAALSGWR